MTSRSSWMGTVGSLAAVAVLFAGAVRADGAGDGPLAQSARLTVEATLPALGHALDEDRLDLQRGGQDDAYANINEARARVSETSVTNASTGNNIVSEGSITNNAGLPIVVQNSGNGVVIQNTTILNLQLK